MRWMCVVMFSLVMMGCASSRAPELPSCSGDNKRPINVTLYDERSDGNNAATNTK